MDLMVFKGGVTIMIMKSTKKAKIAINGFGRIGRLFFRQAFNKFDIVAINDLSEVENLAYLLKHDSVYRDFGQVVSVKKAGDQEYLMVGKNKVLVTKERDPEKLPWKKLGIDVVVESTGVFDSFEESEVHLKAGAKKVVITAPATDEDREGARTVLLGVNEEQFKVCKITSNGSCTTNATHPVAAIMNETVGVLKGMLSTTHGYTATQNLVDGIAHSKDMRRGRAAAVNIVPASSGAAISVTRAVTDLVGKFDAIALRVPMITGSLGDFTFLAARKTSVQEVNDIFKKAAKTNRWKKILAVTEDQLVSSDIIGQPYGSIVDLSYTKVIGGDFVKVLAWYDNEWGYVTTLVEHVRKAAEAL